MEFDDAVEIIIKHEGGSKVSNHSSDPGGLTKFGISQRSYKDVDIENLTLGHAKDIYRRDYWNACKCEGLPSYMRLMVFDCAVNQGVTFATQTLQRVLGVKRDGVIGEKTMKEAHKVYPPDFISEYAIQRLDRYMKIKTFDVFGKGWTRRLVNITAIS